MPATHSEPKTERVVSRVSPEVKALLAQAASWAGFSSIDQFIVQSALREAERLVDATVRTVRLLGDFAVVAMIVDAKDAHASSYYQHFGFIPLLDDLLKLYLPAQALIEVYASMTDS